jgi:hypothetical protein
MARHRMPHDTPDGTGDAFNLARETGAQAAAGRLRDVHEGGMVWRCEDGAFGGKD